MPPTALDCLLRRLLLDFGLRTLVGVEVEFYILGLGQIVSEFEFLCSCASNFLIIQKEKGEFQYEFTTSAASAHGAINELYLLKGKLVDISSALGLVVDFRPKPYLHDYGSAAHYHISLYKDDLNIFSNSSIEENEFLNNAISGIMSMSECGFTSFSDEHDLKRLVPGFMAPTHISWGKK